MSSIMLSLNWKDLQKRLGGSKPNKVSKKSLQTSTKSKKNLTKALNNPQPSPEPKDTNPSPAQSGSVLELALWNNEATITADLIVAKPLSGNKKRKLEPGKYIAIDCEFVGIGKDGEESALARVSVVNYFGHVLYDQFVKPREKVTDWRTWVSGVTPAHMNNAVTFEEAQKVTSDLLKDKILVGHAVYHDLDSLFLSHPRAQLRDTSKFGPFRQLAKGRNPSLKKLTLHYLKLEIQGGEHSSVEDARATMLLYRMHKNEFEDAARKNVKSEKPRE